MNDFTDLSDNELDNKLNELSGRLETEMKECSVPIYLVNSNEVLYNMKFQIRHSVTEVGVYYLKGCFSDKNKREIDCDLDKKICAPYKDADIYMELVLKTTELLTILAAIHNNKVDRVKKIIEMLFSVRLTQKFQRGIITPNEKDLSASELVFVSLTRKEENMICSVDLENLTKAFVRYPT